MTLAATLAPAQQPFTLQQILSAPYALSLTAAPAGGRFAWVENVEGRRNLWVGGSKESARQITQYTEDDGQDLDGVVWSPDGTNIAYSRGAETGADGKPANPAHLQRATPVEVWVVSLAPSSQPVLLGEGHSPVFTRDGRGVLFVHGGQIHIADLASPSAHQLVFDRGSASSLTLSPDGKLLAFVSHRKDHSFIGLFDLSAHTLRFLSPSTGSDFAPKFSADGKQIAWLREPFTGVPEFAANRVSAYPWSIQWRMLKVVETHTLYSPKPNERGSVTPHLSSGGPRLLWATGGRLLFSVKPMAGYISTRYLRTSLARCLVCLHLERLRWKMPLSMPKGEPSSMPRTRLWRMLRMQTGAIYGRSILPAQTLHRLRSRMAAASRLIRRLPPAARWRLLPAMPVCLHIP